MTTTTTITTALEYSTMDIQRYEILCPSCWTIKTIADCTNGSIGTGSVQAYCKDCLTGTGL